MMTNNNRFQKYLQKTTNFLKTQRKGFPINIKIFIIFSKKIILVNNSCWSAI